MIVVCSKTWNMTSHVLEQSIKKKVIRNITYSVRFRRLRNVATQLGVIVFTLKIWRVCCSSTTSSRRLWPHTQLAAGRFCRRRPGEMAHLHVVTGQMQVWWQGWASHRDGATGEASVCGRWGQKYMEPYTNHPWGYVYENTLSSVVISRFNFCRISLHETRG